jgi:hypothetical protein
MKRRYCGGAGDRGISDTIAPSHTAPQAQLRKQQEIAMKFTNLSGILDSLNFLDEKKIRYELCHTIDDCLTAMVYVPGVRIEMYFYEDRFEYSVFRGDESVETDLQALLELLSDD